MANSTACIRCRAGTVEVVACRILVGIGTVVGRRRVGSSGGGVGWWCTGSNPVPGTMNNQVRTVSREVAAVAGCLGCTIPAQTFSRQRESDSSRSRPEGDAVESWLVADGRSCAWRQHHRLHRPGESGGADWWAGGCERPRELCCWGGTVMLFGDGDGARHNRPASVALIAPT